MAATERIERVIQEIRRRSQFSYAFEPVFPPCIFGNLLSVAGSKPIVDTPAEPSLDIVSFDFFDSEPTQDNYVPEETPALKKLRAAVQHIEAINKDKLDTDRTAIKESKREHPELHGFHLSGVSFDQACSNPIVENNIETLFKKVLAHMESAKEKFKTYRIEYETKLFGDRYDPIAKEMRKLDEKLSKLPAITLKTYPKGVLDNFADNLCFIVEQNKKDSLLEEYKTKLKVLMLEHTQNLTIISQQIKDICEAVPKTQQAPAHSAATGSTTHPRK